MSKLVSAASIRKNLTHTSYYDSLYKAALLFMKKNVDAVDKKKMSVYEQSLHHVALKDLLQLVDAARKQSLTIPEVIAIIQNSNKGLDQQGSLFPKSKLDINEDREKKVDSKS